jgi:hypothetical protein
VPILRDASHRATNGRGMLRTKEAAPPNRLSCECRRRRVSGLDDGQMTRCAKESRRHWRQRGLIRVYFGDHLKRCGDAMHSYNRLPLFDAPSPPCGLAFLLGHGDGPFEVRTGHGGMKAAELV